MSFSHGHIEASCDVCGMDTDPLDCGGSFDAAAAELVKDGWRAVRETMNYRLTCPDCLAEEADQ